MRTYLDIPIEHSHDDWMMREPFARTLGKGILNRKDKDSFVIGLYGKWGTGKSSIKNLCVKYIRSQKNIEIPHILEFKPWLFSSPEQLLTEFFKEFGLQLNKFEDQAESSKATEEWNLYTSGLKLTKPLASLIPTLAVLVASHFTQNPSDLEQVNTVVKNVVDSALPLLEAGASAGEIVYSTKDELNKSLLSSQSSLTMDDLKRKLSERLAAHSHPGVLIIIDDIDRLSPENIRLMIQLVKACCDFPKTTYLLCYERTVVEKSLQTVAYSGRSYLEKIIQVSFNVPEVAPNLIFEKLESEIIEILSKPWASDRDSRRWNTVFEISRSAFKTPRDLYRYLNALSFHASIFSSEEGLEVNPIDLALIEMVRYFEPRLHEGLYNSKALLFQFAIVHDLISGSNYKTELTKVRDQFDNFLESSFCNDVVWCKNILKSLFPYLSNVWEIKGVEAISHDLWHSSARICDEVSFERYFQLTIPTNDLTRKDVDSLLQSLKTYSSAIKTLRKFKKSNRLNTAINKLDSIKSKIPESYAGNYIEALLKIADESEYFEHCLRAIEKYILNLKQSQRFLLLQQCCSKSDVLSPLVHLIRDLGGKDIDGRALLDRDSYAVLTDIACARLKKASKTGELITHPRLLFLSIRWSDWCKNSDAHAAIAKELKTNTNLFRVLSIIFDDIINAPLIEENHPDHFYFQFDLASKKAWLDKFLDVKAARKKLQNYIKRHSSAAPQLKILDCLNYIYADLK